MRWLVLAMLFGCSVAEADRAPTPRLVGKWRVVGCSTSPRDPADCARGEIIFEGKRWSVTLPCCKRSESYKVLSATAETITIESAGERTEIRLDKDGTAHWAPGGLDGRVGALSFVRQF